MFNINGVFVGLVWIEFVGVEDDDGICFDFVSFKSYDVFVIL